MRWYDQQLGRFAGPDPLQEKYPQLSPHLYCAANPLRYTKSTGWINGHELKIHYGDITKQSWYKSWMGLLSGDKAPYAKNSKGKLVQVEEVDCTRNKPN